MTKDKRILRPYQQQGYIDIFNCWESFRLLMFVLATGGGKTFLFTEVIRNFYEKGLRIILVAHREELIIQNWRSLFNAGMMAGIIKHGYPNKYEYPIQVCSIQTLARRKNLPKADLIIIDEAHHVQEDNTYGRLINQYNEAKVLMVTATPYRLSGKGFLDIVEGEAPGLIVNSSLSDLINDGWLVPVRYFVGSIPDFSGVPIIKGDYEEEGARKIMQLAPIVQSYKDSAYGKKGICYCINVEHSKEITVQYLSVGIAAAHLDADTPEDERLEIQNNFRSGKVLIICNVGILTEGADFPDCDFVQLARPTKSLSMYLQMIGRATRTLTGLVDQFSDHDERIQAINNSLKPNCIILDNAGCWLDHGFPDGYHDWPRYFKGWRKPKIQEDPNFIEIPIFVIEDPDTNKRTTTKNIKEVIGMILIEVTYERKARLRTVEDIKKFEMLYHYALKNPDNIQKPGYWAYYRFRDYCEKHNIDISKDIWDYIYMRLVEQIEKEIDLYIDQKKDSGNIVVPSINKDISIIRMRGLHKLFLLKEKQRYIETTKSNPLTM